VRKLIVYEEPDKKNFHPSTARNMAGKLPDYHPHAGTDRSPITDSGFLM